MRYDRYSATSLVNFEKDLRQAGALWNEDATAVLKCLGLTQSKYDQCVFLSKSMMIILYVNDLFILYESDEDLDVIQDIIISAYGGDMKHPIDGVMEFLGMKFQLNDKGVSITMPAKINEVIEGIERLKGHVKHLLDIICSQ